MELHRHTYEQFLLHGHALPKAPKGLRKHTLFHGLIFGKLLVIGHVQGKAYHLGFKLRCRCLCTGGRDVWEHQLLNGSATDCGCVAKWREKKRRQTAKKRRADYDVKIAGESDSQKKCKNASKINNSKNHQKNAPSVK